MSLLPAWYPDRNIGPFAGLRAGAGGGPTDIVERLQAALEGRYRIAHELGSGGMATVFLAEDLRHHRRVALKVLRPEIAATLGAERFAREIEVAARLQHPNILPLLDSGEAGGFFFYAMPYVEGESLRDRLGRSGELAIPDAVRILVEVADALSHAHAHGVVHRDIKPDNVLISGRHALVADFGVAKAVTEATGRQLLTSAGVALGTPAYMAPEQAVADPHQDHRVDIYALGVLGYELLTGRAPFTATTAQEMLAAHVTTDPEPLELYRPSVPPALAQILMKCLARRPADRWQTADELVQQLEPLATPSGGTTPVQTAPVAAFRPRRVAWAAAAGVVVVLVVLALWVGMFRAQPLNITVSDLTQITNAPGVEFEPALSPDGGMVAYAAGPMGAPWIEVRSTAGVAGGGAIRLSDTSVRSAYVPVWSPDGQLVRFAACTVNRCGWDEVGKLGGVVRQPAMPKRARSVQGAWSPDGTRVAYFVADSLMVAAAADTATPSLVAVQRGLVWDPHSLAWSPDGKMLAYVNGNPAWRNSGNVSPSSVWVVSVAGGTPRLVTDEDHVNVSPVWLDSRHLLFVSNRDGARGVYVVEIASDGRRGEARIIPGIADPHSISYAIDSRQLAWAKFTLRQNVWSYPLAAAKPISIRDGVRVTTGNEVTEVSDLSPDGKWLTFDSNRRGNMDLYKMPASGGEATPLTDAPEDEFNPRWSPDGTEIAFYTNVRRSGALWNEVAVVTASGGQPTSLTAAPGFNDFPSWSPDGLHIAFLSTRTGRSEAWLLSRGSVGGPWRQEAQLTDSGGVPADWAPDGSGVLCFRGLRIFIVSPQKLVLWSRDLAASGLVHASPGRFSPDGRTLYFFATDRNGRSGIWALPMRGGNPRLVVTSDDPALSPLTNLSIGRDRLYVAVSEYESDIWVAKLRW